MSGLGGLNKSPNGVVIGLVQLQLPVVETPADLAAQTQKICRAWSARRGATWRRWIWWCSPNTRCTACRWTPIREIMCRWTGRRSRRSSRPASTTRSGAASRSWSTTPAATRTTAASSSTTSGELQLYYRKLHPWVPVEPWEPGDLGIPVIDGPKGAKLALIICHDGMFPEMAREAAYKGAEIMLRTAGYTAPIRHAWQLHQPGQRVLQPDGHRQRLHVRHRTARFDSMGEGMIVNFDGTHHRRRQPAGPTRSSPPRCGPTSCARRARDWGVENNIYQLGHRGYVAVKGGAQDCPYTFMQDMVAGRYRLPWEDEVQVTRRHARAASPHADARLWRAEVAARPPDEACRRHCVDRDRSVPEAHDRSRPIPIPGRSTAISRRPTPR